MQTVLASKLARPPAVATRAERVELDDGDFLDLAHGIARGDAEDVSRGASRNVPTGETLSATAATSPTIGPATGPIGGARSRAVSDTPVVALFHGLAGGLASAYVQGAIGALERRGFRVSLMHWRGCSGEPNRLRRAYHSGASDDVARMVELLRARHPEAPLYAVGFSLGGNALLKYLGERGEGTPLSGALAVCPPLVLEVGATQLDRGFARGYRSHLLGLMRAQHEAKRARYPALELPPAHAGLDSFWSFDDVITAPLHGFAGVDDYYARCGARRYLGGIRRPTHILSARDDPFFTEAILPEADELARGTTLEIARRGGHVGFLASGAGTTGVHRWLDARVGEIVANLHRRHG